jgi:CRISPR/Cas system-associated exonuclease Cas4 (RecB family)
MIADTIHKIAADIEKEKEERQYSARPSLAGIDRCIRQCVYWGLNYPKKPIAGRMILIFDDSSWHEELTGDWLRKSVYKLHSQQMHVNIPAGLGWLPERVCGFKGCKEKIPKGHLGGHIDGILTDLVGKDILLEHKAINHFTFGMYEKAKVFPTDYIVQTCLYLLGLQEIQPELNEALLLIKNKNTSQYFEYYLRYDSGIDTATLDYAMSSTDCERIVLDKKFENVVQTAFDRFSETQKHIDKKEIPPRQYDKSDWQCSYCPYHEICYENWEDEFSKMSTDVVLEEDFETMANYYLEATMHIREMTKEKDALKKQIKEKMNALNVREGIAGKYIIRRRLIEKKEYTVPASSYETLNINLVKEKK